MEGRDQKLRCQALTCACIDQDDSTLKRLLLDPKYLALVNHLGLGGNAPIHIAILSKNAAILNMLLEAGADRNKRNINGDMPMHCACRVGFLEGLKLLCSFRRVIIDGLNDAGQLPIDIATSSEVDSLQESDLYGVFCVQENKIDTSIIDLQGRKDCAEFLEIVASRQKIERLNDFFDETVELNSTKQKVTNVLRDSNKGRSKIYYANFLKPPGGTLDCWSDRDYQTFEKNVSLFNRMIVSVSSICLVKSVMATTIHAYDEKKAVEHQLWLYSRRKELNDTAPHTAGISKNREFFKTPVAESGKRDNLPEYDYTSYDIDNIMSDEEAEYIMATDDMVTSMLLLAMKVTATNGVSEYASLTRNFVNDVLRTGLINSSRKILDSVNQLNFADFSRTFMSSIVDTGLQHVVMAGGIGSAAFTDEVLTQGIAGALDIADADISAQACAVAKKFVVGIINATPPEALRDAPESVVSAVTEKLVADILLQGISSYNGSQNNTKHNYGRVSKNGTAAVEQSVENMLLRLMDDDDCNNEKECADSVSAFSKSFVANLFALNSNRRTESGRFFSEFSKQFVAHIISSIGSPLIPSTRNEWVSSEAAVAESFVKLIMEAGLRAFDDQMSQDYIGRHISDVVSSFPSHGTAEGN